jgi:hypothetical protein
MMSRLRRLHANVVPMLLFVLACSMVALAGPAPALLRLRLAAEPTGTCCHVASFKRTGLATVDVSDQSLFGIISFRVHITFQSNGNLLAQASIRNTKLEIPHLKGKLDCRIDLSPNADPGLCHHFAAITDDVEASWKIGVPAILNIGLLEKSQVSLKIKPQVIAVENFDGVSSKISAQKEAKVEITKALGLEEVKVSFGKEGVGIDVPIALSLELPRNDSDADVQTIIDEKPFTTFAALSVRHDIPIFEMQFLIGVGSLTGEGSTRVSPPTLVDTMEACWVKFTGPNTLLFKKDCNTPEKLIPPPQEDTAFEKKLGDHILAEERKQEKKNGKK